MDCCHAPLGYPRPVGIVSEEGRKSWERNFPSLLRSYYAAFANCGNGGRFYYSTTGHGDVGGRIGGCGGVVGQGVPGRGTLLVEKAEYGADVKGAEPGVEGERGQVRDTFVEKSEGGADGRSVCCGSVRRYCGHAGCWPCGCGNSAAWDRCQGGLCSRGDRSGRCFPGATVGKVGFEGSVDHVEGMSAFEEKGFLSGDDVRCQGARVDFGGCAATVVDDDVTLGDGCGKESLEERMGPGKAAEVVVGGSVNEVKGVNWKRNRAAREKKKRQKAKSGTGVLGAAFDAVPVPEWRRSATAVSVAVDDVREKSELRRSLEAKWAAENALKTARAERELELLKAKDIEEEKKAQSARIKKAANRDLVAIEKAFSELRAAGDVPGCVTVVSDDGRVVSRDENGNVMEVPVFRGNESISPDSSASQHEFRQAQLRILELEKECRRLRHSAEYVKLDQGEEAAFTLNSDGEAAPSVKVKLDEAKKRGVIFEENYTIPGTLFACGTNWDEVRDAEYEIEYAKNPVRRVCSDGKIRRREYGTEDGSVFE